MKRLLIFAVGIVIGCAARGQGTQPIVAIHDSELTRALESTPASSPTPTGAGTTGFEWWPADWRYFTLPEALKEALRSDGTAFNVVSDANITSGLLLANGTPRFPIMFSLGCEAVRNDEIGPLTNYVAAGGFLFVGSSSFTRNPNGTSRGDYAIANELGVRTSVAGLENWGANSYFTRSTAHRLVAHIPDGQLTWRMPSASEETCWGTSPSHPFLAPHDVWRVRNNGATVLAQGDSTPYLTIKPYGKGYFIFYAPMQPLIGHGGFAPGMYSYLILRNAIEWAFERANVPVAKVSPWPYQYDAAFIVRHDLENYTNSIARIEASAQVEASYGAKGDYYFCTGTLREDAYRSYNTNTIVTGLRNAVSKYGATIGPHNGGLKNPVNTTLARGAYDYWHWGPDEALDVTPSGYQSGKAYALKSMSDSFLDIESWLSGLNGPRAWVGCYFNATREDSYDIQAQLNVKIAGEQKLSPFPHWTLSTRTSGKLYGFVSQPVSDWFVGGLVAQSLEPWHPPGVFDSQSLRAAIDFYYNLGSLINIYSHTLATGEGDAGSLVQEYISYSLNTNIHPRIWSANAVGIYNWWVQRSDVVMTAAYATNGSQYTATLNLQGARSADTAVELLLPGADSYCGIQVLIDGALAGADAFRLKGRTLKVRAGTTARKIEVRYAPLGNLTQTYAQNFDSVTAPALPTGWTTASSGAQATWTIQTSVRDSLPNAAFSASATAVGVNELVSAPITLPAGRAQLVFRNNYDLEPSTGTMGYDGGVLEIKIGSAAFADIIAAGGNFVSGGYNSTLDTAYGNPLGGRGAWSGTSAGFITTAVSLPTAAGGQTVQFRWRCGSDDSNARSGWRIDTISITNQGCFTGPVTNTAPVLPSQADRSVPELVAMTVTNTAADAEQVTLSYALLAGPTGASISSTGIITWTPTEIQGPGVATFVTRVTDNGSPALSATNSFTVTVTEVNLRPVLPAQTSRSVNELSTLTVTNTATDADLPANGLLYSLLNPPAGATISPAGVISWTPTAAQGPSTNLITTVVSDNGVPVLSATNSFTVVVIDPNTPPVIISQPVSRTNLVGTTATFTVGASGNQLSYQWFKGSVNVAGATLATLTLPSVTQADAGGYQAVVSNPSGSVTSAVATLTVTTNTQTQLFADDFTRPTNPGSLSPWITQNGTWGITNGVLSGAPRSQNYGVLYVSGTWTDYSVQARIRFPAGAYGGGISGRLNASSGVRYAVWVHPDNSPGGANQVKLLKMKNWKAWAYNGVNSAVMQQVSVPSVGTDWHTLKLTFVGSQITVLYDGAQIMNVTDTESTRLLSGGIAADVRSSGTAYNMQFDDFVVTSASAATAPAMVLSTPAPFIESVVLENGKAVITSSAVRGNAYRLEYKSSLEDEQWVDTGLEIIASDSSVVLVDSTGLTKRRFYRVVTSY